MFAKIFGFIALVSSFAALLFRGQMFKSQKARVEDREAVKDKARDIQDKSSAIRRTGAKKVKSVRGQPIDYAKSDDEF